MVQSTTYGSLLVTFLALVHGSPIATPNYGTAKGYSNSRHNARVDVDIAKALYFITNDKQNSVVALPIAKNGTLSAGSLTPTGGAGSNIIDPKTGGPAVPDALVSQGSVRVAGDLLFAVNAGSNTLSMFKIDRKDPTKLEMLGHPVNTCGEFPNTLAVSKKHKVACVANTGAKAGISCARFSSKTGLAAMDDLRPFNFGQTTPPTGPTNGVADTFFNAEETILITTVKGDPAVNNTGFVSVFTVEEGFVSREETRSSPAGTAVLFGTVNIPGTTNLLATDASFGFAVLHLDEKNKASVVAKTPLDNQKATCWATISKKTGTGFIVDVAVNRLVEADVQTGAIISILNLNTTNPGLIDLEAGGDFIYALSPGNANVTSAIAVFDVSGGKGTAKQIQNFNPPNVDANAQGMAVLT